MTKHSPFLFLLWDDSQIWGIMAARAMRSMGVPHRLVRASEITVGLLDRQKPSILLVPGGNARHKALDLGPGGLDAIRTYVHGGGRYLGFCGGAGLALTGKDGAEGLGLCPWQRGRFDDRIQHFMSGHLHVALSAVEEHAGLIPPNMSASPRLPVWWPGRFEVQDHPDVNILASYESPAEDFWLADLPIADLPADTFAAWQDLYGLSFTPTFLAGQPCVVHGRYGAGEYILSYSHLETPESPDANRWLAYLLQRLAGINPELPEVPAWHSHGQQERWQDPVLVSMWEQLKHILTTGLKHGLLFRRTDWLYGWRTGIPGAHLNSLWAALGAVIEHGPGPLALARWEEEKERISRVMEVFSRGCCQYLLAERLALTLSRIDPDAVPPSLLKDQRESLFGPPMQAEGLYREIMEPLDELAYLQLSAM